MSSTIKLALIFGMSLSMTLLPGAYAEDSKTQPDPSEPMKGRVLKIDNSNGQKGMMPRLARPGMPTSVLSGKLDQSTLKGEAENDVLRSRVLHAAGLGGLTDFSSPGKPSAYSLSATDLQHLSKYDITVLIDASGSMCQRDCEPMNIFEQNGNISRWEWCRQQTDTLSQEIANVFPKGITIIPFASHAERFPNVNPSTISSIFQQLHPGGGTRLEEAFDIYFSNYFDEKQRGGKHKPQLIAVITDGVPNFPQAVLNEILEATKLTDPGEIHIEFFLIGEARRGASYVQFLSELRERGGAKFDMVSNHSFEEICKEGLPRSLARSVDNYR